MNGNPDQPEWKQQKPHERIEDEREQRQRPAQNEQDAPEQEGEHEKLLNQ